MPGLRDFPLREDPARQARVPEGDVVHDRDLHIVNEMEKVGLVYRIVHAREKRIGGDGSAQPGQIT